MKAKYEVLTYTKEQLKNLSFTNTQTRTNILAAVSTNKIQWLLKAPRIEENDICLVLGLADEQMVAYIHIIPDILNTSNEDSKKVSWLYEWWVKEEFKDTILGMYVYNEGLKACNNKAITKANAESTNIFYKKQPFSELTTRKRHTIFLGLNPDSIIVKLPFLKFARGVLNRVDKLAQKSIRVLNKLKIGKTTANLSYTYMHELNEETWAFIAPLSENDTIKKTREYIDWHLDPVQYITTPISQKLAQNSKIKGYTKNIALHTFNVVSKNNTIAFISILDFNKEVYIKYFITTDEHYESALNALMEHCLTLKTSHIFTDDAKLALAFNKKFTKTFIYAVNKTAWAHDSIFEDAKNLQLNDQDGHFI